MFMKILNKARRLLFRFVYSLPFGMKAGEILSTSISSNSAIEQKVNNKRLSVDLLRGEVTQQVEELRYRDYLVSEESRNYKYIGNGEAVKIKSTNEFNGKIKFTQKNERIVNDILSELNRIGTNEDSLERYTLKITYKEFPRFKLERYCKWFEVDVNEKDNRFKISLHFYAQPDSSITSNKMFLNEIKKVLNGDIKNELNDDLDNIFFITDSVEGERNYVSYNFTNLKIESFEKLKDEYIINYSSENYKRVDLLEKMKSNTMEEKYKNKERKEIDTSVYKIDY